MENQPRLCGAGLAAGYGKSLKFYFSLWSEGISSKARFSLFRAKQAELPFQNRTINPVTMYFDKTFTAEKMMLLSNI